jgi:hypothetical protein
METSGRVVSSAAIAAAAQRKISSQANFIATPRSR